MKKSGKKQFDNKEWEALKRRYKYRCVRCSIKEEKTEEGFLTADHVIPLAFGGSRGIYNIQPLCLPCNQAKGSNVWDYRERKFKS